MHLPRLAIFRSQRGPSSIPINHIVMVDGDVWRPICVRNQVKHGYLIEVDSTITCTGCLNKGWIKTLGLMNPGVVKDANGRFLTREEAEASRQMS